MRSNRAADSAIVGARVITLDPERPTATAVAWRNGVIIAVGSDGEVRATCDAHTSIVHGPDFVCVPGLVDAHMHPLQAEQTRGVDLRAATSIEDVQHLLRRAREHSHLGDWVLGWGASYAAFSGSDLTGDLIAQAVNGAPALITFMDLHTAIATPEALHRSSVDGSERFDTSAEVVVRDGMPTGELRETPAIDLVRGSVPPMGSAERSARVREILRGANEVGLTGIHVMAGGFDTFELLDDLEAEHDLTARLVVPLVHEPSTTPDDMAEIARSRRRGGRRWRAGAVKFFMDGVIETGTAWLTRADQEGGGQEAFWPDTRDYVRAVAYYASAGMQCVTHAVGDRAVRTALDAYRSAPVTPNVTHRVEHVELARLQDLPRFHAEGVAASMQPLHMQWRSPDGSDPWSARLGADRTSRAFPTGALARSGAILALGSDWAVADYDPRIGAAWARLRRPPGYPELPAFEPAQRLTAAQALAGYTIGPAAAVNELSMSGRIRPGFRADLTVCGADPLELDGDALVDMPIHLTIVDGTIVFRSHSV